jgi:RimJ/RimL family protein N-acetyltransferase
MQQVLDRRIVGAREQPDYGLPAVELRATGQVVGAVLLSPLPGDDTAAEIGWHLNPDYWGAGYATYAGRGAVALALGLDSRPGPRRLTGLSLVDNIVYR